MQDYLTLAAKSLKHRHVKHYNLLKFYSKKSQREIYINYH